MEWTRSPSALRLLTKVPEAEESREACSSVTRPNGEIVEQFRQIERETEKADGRGTRDSLP